MRKSLPRHILLSLSSLVVPLRRAQKRWRVDFINVLIMFCASRLDVRGGVASIRGDISMCLIPALRAMESSMEDPMGILSIVMTTPENIALPGAQFLMGDSGPHVSYDAKAQRPISMSAAVHDAMKRSVNDGSPISNQVSL